MVFAMLENLEQASKHGRQLVQLLTNAQLIDERCFFADLSTLP